MQGDVNVGRIVMIKSFCRVILCFIIAAAYVTLVNVAFLFGKVIGTLLPIIVLIAFLKTIVGSFFAVVGGLFLIIFICVTSAVYENY